MSLASVRADRWLDEGVNVRVIPLRRVAPRQSLRPRVPPWQLVRLRECRLETQAQYRSHHHCEQAMCLSAEEECKRVW